MCWSLCWNNAVGWSEEHSPPNWAYRLDPGRLKLIVSYILCCSNTKCIYDSAKEKSWHPIQRLIQYDLALVKSWHVKRNKNLKPSVLWCNQLKVVVNKSVFIPQFLLIPLYEIRTHNCMFRSSRCSVQINLSPLTSHPSNNVNKVLILSFLQKGWNWWLRYRNFQWLQNDYPYR